MPKIKGILVVCLVLLVFAFSIWHKKNENLKNEAETILNEVYKKYKLLNSYYDEGIIHAFPHGRILNFKTKLMKPNSLFLFESGFFSGQNVFVWGSNATFSCFIQAKNGDPLSYTFFGDLQTLSKGFLAPSELLSCIPSIFFPNSKIYFSIWGIKNYGPIEIMDYNGRKCIKIEIYPHEWIRVSFLIEKDTHKILQFKFCRARSAARFEKKVLYYLKDDYYVADYLIDFTKVEFNPNFINADFLPQIKSNAEK